MISDSVKLKCWNKCIRTLHEFQGTQFVSTKNTIFVSIFIFLMSFSYLLLESLLALSMSVVLYLDQWVELRILMDG